MLEIKSDSTALFRVDPNANNETLITNSYETFTAVSTLLLDLSEELSGKHRDIALAIHQLSELGVLLTAKLCSGQLIPDTTLSFSSARAGAIPPLNW